MLLLFHYSVTLLKAILQARLCWIMVKDHQICPETKSGGRLKLRAGGEEGLVHKQTPFTWEEEHVFCRMWEGLKGEWVNGGSGEAVTICKVL